ncbi:MAG: choice-of-anchor J domain-containing protein [Bacteroidales bacterium]|nr:choice-of-anchor J domain-containing protein [Bacteroidales bacterium]
MMRKELSILFILTIIPFLLQAEWVHLQNGKTTKAPPNVTLLSDNSSETVIKIELSGFEKQNFITGNKQYHKIDLLSESFITDPGNPALPYIAKVLAIPDQAGVTVEVLATGEVQTFNDIYLPPARESWLEGSPETPYVENPGVYHSQQTFPNEYATFDPPSIFRDFRITRVSVFPVRYNPGKKELQVVSSITIRVNYGAGQVTNPKTTAKKPIAPSFGQLYNSFIFNYQSVLDAAYGGKETGHELMLCILPDDFYDSFLSYAEWKRKSGIDIHITKFSEIGANSSDPDIIRNHIADAYFNWEVTPTYALLIGDDGIIPHYTSSGYVDENYYVEIDGGDYFPEMMLGRFTNQSDYSLQVMINKFQKYEKTPYIATNDWLMKGICCSNDLYQSQVETKRYAAERMLEDGNFISVDTMMSDPGCTYSVADVVAAVNNGRSWVNYRGEGWTSGWGLGGGNNCTPMKSSDVQNLNNGEKLSFVTSIGCGVAMFASGECFGETWIELGSLTSSRGAACFIGPAGNTHTTYNNKIDKGIYLGMFTEDLFTSGQGFLRGKLYLYNVYGTDPYVEYHYKIYCILGDPSMHIWKDQPLDVEVDYPATIVFGNSFVEFTVNHSENGMPVENAIVCVTGNDVFASGITDANGTVILDITANDPETLTVTVTGRTVYPWEGTMEVVPPLGPWCVADYIVLNDVAGGNGNGDMDYGEDILLSLGLKNIGTTVATNVNVVISTNDPYITITDHHHNFPSIPSGQTLLATDGYSFTVADDFPDGHEVTFNVAATMVITTWNSHFFISGHAPVLSMGTITINDINGNNNGLLDPGENVTITIPVINEGSSTSPDAIVNVSTTSDLITLNTTSDNVGMIEPGANPDASFNLTVSPTAPTGETVDLDFEVVAGSFNANKLAYTSIGVMVEDWETGNFSKFPWTMGGNANWTIVTDNPYQGLYSARSGNITDNQTSELELTVSVTGDGEIKFFRKVSSENNYDYLNFFIDGNQVDQWAGTVDWGQVSYAVTAGLHTFKWQYYKDYSISNGEDCAWIDYIEFPYPEPPLLPPYQTSFEESGNLPDGWFNDTGDDFDWTVISGPTPTGVTGPSGDHTTGSGYYVYTEATYNNPEYQADLVTPTFNLSLLENTEVSFWYHMYDNNGAGYPQMGDLHLDVFHNDVWIEDVMTTISGNQGDQWHQQIVDLSAFDGEIIKIRFRGITGVDYASDICIDDFSIDGTPVPTGISVDLTTFLEGPCDGTEMSTFLCSCSAIPLAQPYFNSPWYYEGTESVTIMPGNAVDWILVELRDANSASEATPGTMIGRKAGLLLNDGSIVSTDGESPLFFNISVTNGLYTVIHHRNHLAVMSANEVFFTGVNYTYDFTTGSEQAYGTGSLKLMTGGMWCMISGDADANGMVEANDYTSEWGLNSGMAGYLPADLNFDQQVNNVDKDDYWTPNIGMGTNVPD